MAGSPATLLVCHAHTRAGVAASGSVQAVSHCPSCEPRGWGPVQGPAAASRAHWLVSRLWAQLPPGSWQTSGSNREGVGPGLSASQEPIL